MAPRILRRIAESLSMGALSILLAFSIGLVGGTPPAEALSGGLRVFGVFSLGPLLLWFVASLIMTALRRSRTDRELFRWELLLMGIALLLAMGVWVLSALRDPFDWGWLIVSIALPYVLALALIALVVLMCSRLVFSSREPARVRPLVESKH